MNNGNKLWLTKILTLLKSKIDSKHDATISVTKASTIHAVSAANGEDEGEFVITFTEGESVTEVE